MQTCARQNRKRCGGQEEEGAVSTDKGRWIGRDTGGKQEEGMARIGEMYRHGKDGRPEESHTRDDIGTQGAR